MMEKSSIDLDLINRQLTDEKADASRIIQWASDHFGDGLVMTSSFGAQSAVMLHLATQVVPDIPVILIDTGYLFPETYQFVEQLTERLNLNLKVYVPQVTAARMEALYGKLWDKDVEHLKQYHQFTKIEPLQRALRELKVTAWLAGLRGQQTDFRSGLRFVEMQNEQFKVHPILTWSTKDVHEYLKKHDLPYHPLYEQGYASIGDVHLTQPVTAGMSEREGRFRGLKQECGIHLPTTQEESQSRDASGL